MPRFLHSRKSAELLSSFPFFGDSNNKQSRNRSVRLTKNRSSAIPSAWSGQKDPSASSPSKPKAASATSNRQSLLVAPSRFPRFSLPFPSRRETIACTPSKEYLVRLKEYNDEGSCNGDSRVEAAEYLLSPEATITSTISTAEGSPAAILDQEDHLQITTPPRRGSLNYPTLTPQRRSSLQHETTNPVRQKSHRRRTPLQGLFNYSPSERNGGAERDSLLRGRSTKRKDYGNTEKASPKRRSVSIYSYKRSSGDVPRYDVGRYPAGPLAADAIGRSAPGRRLSLASRIPPTTPPGAQDELGAPAHRRFSSAQEMATVRAEQNGLAPWDYKQRNGPVVFEQKKDLATLGEDVEATNFWAPSGTRKSSLDLVREVVHEGEDQERLLSPVEECTQATKEADDVKASYESRLQAQSIEQDADAEQAEQLYAAQSRLWVEARALPPAAPSLRLIFPPSGKRWRNSHKNYFPRGCKRLSQRWIIRSVTEKRRELGLLLLPPSPDRENGYYGVEA